MNKKNNYDNSSISSLKGADRVRKRPSVIFGSDGIDGCYHSFFEILSNSIDEAREGYGNKIEVVYHLDNSITVRDYGRGIPMDYNKKEGRYNWELVFCELYAGGKYSNNDDITNYEYSLGLNGLGACATQYSSEYMTVTVFRDNYKYYIEFENGEVKTELKKTKENSDYGTIIKYKPDLKVFTDIKIPIDYFLKTLKRQAIVNKGIEFIFFDEKNNQTNTFLYENGIKDYLTEINENKNITDIQYFFDQGVGRDREDKNDYKLKVELAFCFNNDINLLEYYHNSSFLEHGGSPDKAVKNAFVYEIDKFIKKENKYIKDEKKVTFNDISDSLVLVINSFSTVTSYENQTKKAINNKFIQEFITDLLKAKLEVYFIENKTEVNKVIEQILINKRSREKAEKTRLNIKAKLSKKVDITNRVKKYVDCRTKDKLKRELYILEGDSALGACKLARDSEFQALMPIRGKILNCLKSEYVKIFKSEIIVDLLKVIGCGVEIKSKHNKNLTNFDINNLDWDKIIICTDADVDGFQIRTLIMSMIYKLMPTLFDEKKVYIAESPLYEISTKNKTYFAYNELEKNEIVNKLDGKYQIMRSKGLGENNPDMMWHTTMNPETRRLICIKMEDVEKTNEMFETLLGDDIDKRKEYINLYGDRYIELLDLN